LGKRNILNYYHSFLSLKNTNTFSKRCGPGTWVLDMGSTYYNNKKSVFVGIDISPTFPNQIKPGYCFEKI
jgi:hypothetical protein